MLVSALIVALIATAVALALIAGAQTDADQRYRSQAAELAQLDQERLKGLSALQLTDLAPPNQETRTVTLNGIPYQITSTANFLNTTGGVGLRQHGRGRRRLLRGHLAGHLGHQPPRSGDGREP